MAEPVPEAPHGQDAHRLDDEGVRTGLERLDELLERVEQVPGPTTDAAVEAVSRLTEVYGEALARLLDLSDGQLARRATDDELLAHLMVLHDLHPDSVEQRVEHVLADVRPLLAEYGGSVELVDIENQIARIRVSAGEGGGGGGCGSCSSSDPVEEAVGEALLALAPELAQVDPVHDEQGASAQALIPVDSLLRRPVGAGGDG